MNIDYYWLFVIQNLRKPSTMFDSGALQGTAVIYFTCHCGELWRSFVIFRTKAVLLDGMR